MNNPTFEIYDLAAEHDDDAASALRDLDVPNSIKISVTHTATQIFTLSHHESDVVCCYAVIVRDLRSEAVTSVYAFADMISASTALTAMLVDAHTLCKTTGPLQCLPNTTEVIMGKEQLRRRLS